MYVLCYTGICKFVSRSNIYINVSGQDAWCLVEANQLLHPMLLVHSVADIESSALVLNVYLGVVNGITTQTCTLGSRVSKIYIF